MRQIRVGLDRKVSAAYDITIGSGLSDRIGLMIAKDHPAATMVIVTDRNVEPLYATPLKEALESSGKNVSMVVLEPGEQAKTMAAVMQVVWGLLEAGADRSSLVIAVGGGVVGDIAGFAASIFMRGIPYVQVATTLIAQTDSSVGGKTGADLPQGKNLVGAFHQPSAVLIDLDCLETLPDRELSNGMAEVIKYGLIDGEALLSYLEENIALAMARDRAVLEEIVDRSCRIKQGIVVVDERETGLRRILNLGHTVGHAIEAASEYKISHGEGVAIGMVAALRLSELRHNLPRVIRKRVEHLLETAGLPTRVPAELDSADIVMRTWADKKRLGGKVNFVLLRDLGMPFVDAGVTDALLTEVLEGMKP